MTLPVTLKHIRAAAERIGRYLLVPIIPLLALYAVLLVQRLNDMLSL